MNLIYNGKKTNAFKALEGAIEHGGIQAVGHRMRKPGERVNWPEVSKLVEVEYLEPRQDGPRGGKRYHATHEGKLAYKEAMSLLLETNHE
ncbi:MAG: hypothetical protein ACYC3N_00100 [Halothiobacillus sp.]|jgi:hypothetical protein